MGVKHADLDLDAGVAVGSGPAWATGDQTMTASATMTRDPTTERRIVALDTVPPPSCAKREWVKSPHIEIIGPEGYSISATLGRDVNFILKL